MHKRIGSYPEMWTRFLIVVPDRQQRKACCTLLQSTSQSPLTSPCSRVQVKTNSIRRVQKGGLRSRKSRLSAANLQKYRPSSGKQLRSSDKNGHMEQGGWPANLRHSPNSSTRLKGRQSCRKMPSQNIVAWPACSRNRKANFEACIVTGRPVGKYQVVGERPFRKGR